MTTNKNQTGDKRGWSFCHGFENDRACGWGVGGRPACARRGKLCPRCRGKRVPPPKFEQTTTFETLKRG
jgi:hypothetical protein